MSQPTLHFAFDRARHDRQAHLRPGDAWVEAARFLVVSGEHVATDGHEPVWLAADAVTDATPIFLGDAGDGPRGALLVDRVPADLEPRSMRELAAALTAQDLSFAVHAVGLGRWLAATPFCPRCGARTSVELAGHQRHCPSCGAHHFPRTDPAVIMLVTDDQDRALIGHQAVWPEGRWSTLAGFVEPGESLEDAVRREVAEETGVGVGEVRYAASQPWPFPASLMVGFFATAESTAITVDGIEMDDARWVTRDELLDEGRAGTLLLPPSGVSISSWLIETWLGQPLTAAW